MAISIQELRKPEPDFSWQTSNANPFGVQPITKGFPWQAQPQAPIKKPRSRGILKFVNYLYDQR